MLMMYEGIDDEIKIHGDGKDDEIKIRFPGLSLERVCWVRRPKVMKHRLRWGESHFLKFYRNPIRIWIKRFFF